MREGTSGPLDTAGLPELALARLTDPDAARLLDRQGRRLTAGVRARVLAEAAGNPLVLMELPATVVGHGRSPLPAVLPLTDRLQRAFTERLDDLPATTRTVLLAAALSEDGRLEDVL